MASKPIYQIYQNYKIMKYELEPTERLIKLLEKNSVDMF